MTITKIIADILTITDFTEEPIARVREVTGCRREGDRIVEAGLFEEKKLNYI